MLQEKLCVGWRGVAFVFVCWSFVVVFFVGFFKVFSNFPVLRAKLEWYFFNLRRLK